MLTFWRLEKYYVLLETDEPISRKNIVYISIIIPILIILAFVMVALVIFMRRYREAKVRKEAGKLSVM